MAFRLGVDVGGTFTDLFLVGDNGAGTQYRVKTPSTPADPSEGVLAGVRRICEESGVAVGDLRNILHGTTVATNAVLESKGARVGLITTQGFAQILHLARSQTPGPLAGWIIMIKPDPPASLADTREAVERMGPRGETVVEVDEQQVESIVRDLVESGVESLTVGLINSYVNPAHEEKIGEIVERLYPGFPVTLSSHVLPEFREYERTLTACMNSYVRPKVATYIQTLEKELSGIGAKGDLNILRSDAGLMTTAEATRNPIYGILSGPSGGVAGALYVARKAGFDDILTFDMGGTSTDVALCQNGEPTIGRPLPGTRALVLDSRQEAVPVRVPGELCLAGEGLARGYLGRPELTAERFVPSPQSSGERPGERIYRTGDLVRWLPDGRLAFLGRVDHQVKVRGFRIELGEVEAALRSCPGVREAVVLARRDGPDGAPRLVAYWTPNGIAPAPAEEELRSALATPLPAYMVPAAFVALAAFPLSPNGKIDRRALPAPEEAGGRPVSRPVGTAMEEGIARIWSEVLGIPASRIGADDHFFRLGGHSLVATRVAARIRASASGRS